MAAVALMAPKAKVKNRKHTVKLLGMCGVTKHDSGGGGGGEGGGSHNV